MKELGSKNNFLGLPKEYSSFKNSGIVILPIQHSSEYTAGNGASGILKASHRMEKYDEEMSSELCYSMGICSVEPLLFKSGSFLKNNQRISDITDGLLKAGKFVITLCGKSSYVPGVIRSCVVEKGELSVLHLDSKARLKGDDEAKSADDSTMRIVSESGTRIIQAGIRSLSKEEDEFRKLRGIRQFLASEIKMGMYGADWQELVNKNLTNHVFISLDISVFDTSIFPVLKGEPGGLFWDEILYLIKITAQDHVVVGMSLTGLKFPKSDANSPYFVSKLIYKILSYIFIKQ